MLLNGQAAVVTGGGSGLARRRRHCWRGRLRVAVLDINRDAAVASAAHAVAWAWLRRCGFGVGRGGAGRGAAAHGVERVLVNCAGVGTAGRIVGRDGPLALAAFERVIRVNLIGSFNMLRLSAAAMCARSRWTRRARRDRQHRVDRGV